MNSFKPASWKQTKIYSCGPASLMTALYELGLGELSEKAEMSIWRQVRHYYFLGSTPAYIAQCAKNRGASTRLWVRKNRTAGKTAGKSPISRLLHGYLLRVYRKTAQKYHAQGNDFSEYCEESELLSHLWSKPGAEAIYLIVDTDEIFHFVLLRPHAGKLVLMDPAFGTNTAFTEKEFLAEYEKRMLGYCVLLNRQANTADTQKQAQHDNF